MARMNLLKANFEGTLGEYTGAVDKGHNIVKARIWSKEPPSLLQTKNVRSFEALNRLAGVIAKSYWYYLPLKQGSMHKHNVVAHWLKGVVKNHYYDPYAITDIIPQGDALNVTQFKVDIETGETQLEILCNLPGLVEGKARYFVCMTDTQGKIAFSTVGTTARVALNAFLPLANIAPYYLIAFASQKVTQNGREVWQVTSPRVLSAGDDRVIWTSSFIGTEWGVVDAITVYGRGAGVSVSGDTIIIA